MRTSSILLHGAALLSCAAAHDAYIWTVDSGAVKYASTQASSISSDTASSIIARRRGLSSGRYLSTVDEGVLQDINQFGGYQVPLFSAGAAEVPEKVLIRISGYNGAVSQFPSLPDLWVEDGSRDLLDDFKARKDLDGTCEYNLSVPTKDGVEIVYSYPSKGSSCMPAREVENLPTILTVYSSVPTAKDASKSMGTFLRMLSHLSVTSGVESTILVLPSASKLSKAKSVRRAPAYEEPLDLPSLTPVSPVRPFSSVAAINGTNITHPLPHNIPVCFTSIDACTNTTNGCSGHGSCYRAHAGCYKCKCGKTTVRQYSDGAKKTVQWGGNACQKKDISVPFVLFATFGVFMSALIFGGIGMMYNMGAQELPSVLGAGVGSSRAQK